MKKRLGSILLIMCMMLTLIPATAMTVLAGGKTKTINCGTFTVEVSNVYAMDSLDKWATEGHFTTYCVVVPASATIKCTKTSGSYNSYLLWPFNDIVFSDGPMYPTVEFACHYDDALYVSFAQGSSISTVVNNEYGFTGGDNERYYNLRIFVVDDETLVQFGGAKPAKKPTAYESKVSASPSKTDFVVKGKGRDTVMDAPQLVTQAYTVNQTNYLQLRAIATLLNRTQAQFDVGWDGQYAVIEPGKPFSGTVTGSKMQNTKDVRTSLTKFKMNGEIFSFGDARLINGNTNYIQLREFAQKLSGTSSQFNVYWDGALGQAVIQPGAPYLGTKYEKPLTVLEQIKGDGEILPDGDYYLQISGKYVYPVPGGQYWLELREKRPDKPFNIKLVSNSKDRGPMYSIAYDGTYIMLPGSAEGAQLQSTTSSTPHDWRINRYSSFCTIRDYSNQKLLVNASGKTSAGNTKIIGSSSTGSAPDNAKIAFFTEAVSNNSQTVVYIQSYPTKTVYKVGEGFDASGLNAVIKEGGVDKNINAQIAFYTSKTVELTQDRPFTTAGTKVVEIRYGGEKFAEYTIVVTENKS